MFLLWGCGEFGLSAAPGPRSQDIDSGGGADTGGVVTEPRVEGTLAEHTYRLDLRTVEPVDPPGLDALLSYVDSPYLLFHVTEERADSLRMVVTLAAGDGSQNPCERVQELPTADWSRNPVFRIDEGELDLIVSGESVVLLGTTLEATVAEDASRWRSGILTATLDAAALTTIVGTDACELVEAMGGECFACDAGECIDLRLESIEATEVDVEFDPGVDDEAC